MSRLAPLGMGLVTALLVITATSRQGAAGEAAARGELSVAPAAQIRYPDDYPEWADADPQLQGDPHRWPVTTTPASSPQLSRQALDAQLRAAAETYLETWLDDPRASDVIPLDDQWLQQRVNPERQYEGELLVGGETMYLSAAELVFDVDLRRQLETAWTSQQVAQRLWATAVLVVLSAIGLLMATAMLSVVARRAERRTGQAATEVEPSGAAELV